MGKLKVLVRNLYGFFVIERVLMRLKNLKVYALIEEEIRTQIQNLSDKNLKHKWQNLLNRNYLDSISNE